VIKLLKARAENFLSLGSVEVDLDGQGLVLLLGQNHDLGGSNGSGKSSLLDMISYALYEKTSRGIGHDAIINTVQQEQGAKIELDFEVAGHPYRVRLTRGHPVHQNSYRLFDGADEWADLTQKGPVGSQIEKLLGVSYDVFRGAVLIGQDDLHEFVFGTNLARQGFFSKLFGFDLWRDCQETARGYIRSAEMAVERIAGQIETAETLLESAEALDDADLIVMQLRTEREKLDRVDVQVADLQNRRKSLDTRITRGREELARKNERMRQVERQQRVRDEVTKKQAQLEELEGKLGDHLTDSQAFEDRYRQICNRVATTESKLGELTEGVEVLQAVEGAKCPTCLRPLDEHDREELVTSLESQKEALAEKLVKYETKQQKAEKIKKRIAEYQRLTHEIAGYRPGGEDEEIDPVEQDVGEEDLKKLETSRRKIENDLAIAEDVLRQAEAEVGRLTEKMKHIGEIEERHAQAQAQLETLKKEQEEAQARLDVFRVAEKDVFPQIRAAKIRALLDTLNAEVARYLAILTEGKVSAAFSFKTKGKGEVLDLTVEDPVKGALPIAAWSGGERKRVTVAVLFALWRLAETVSKSFNFVGFDEILRDVDTLGHAQILEVLRTIRDESKTVIVTTNADPESIPLDVFDQVWIARKEGGITKLLTDPVEVGDIIGQSRAAA